MKANISPEKPSSHAAALRWVTKVQSFTFSTVIHVFLVLLLGGTVLVEKYSKPPDFAGEPVWEDQPVNVPLPTVQLPPSASTPVSAPARSPSAGSASLTGLATLTTNNLTTTKFTLPSPAVPARPTDIGPPSVVHVPSAPTGGLSKTIAIGIAQFTENWAKGGRASFSEPLRSREFEFTAYLAKYEGGDWASTVEIEDDRIWRGSLPNLLYSITKLSRKKLHASPQPVPLDLTSAEIVEKKPPFIWFTGHRDFRLTDKEVVVLGEYLRRGGCIWGDSSLPGRRSRFDVAFRREMLRLVPDPNQPWQPLPANHAIFTKTYYPEIRTVVPGMNFHDEPIYTLVGYGGEIAVIYTANDYGDMWQFGLDEKGAIDLSRDERKRLVAVNEPMWHRRDLYFRNIEPRALLDTYKFGTNIVVHLLTRWEDKVRHVAIGGTR